MPENPVQFPDDPALKSALQRALGKEAAPAMLRARIMQQAGRSVGGAVATSAKAPRGYLFRFAVAAVVVLGFGGLGYQIWQMNRPPVYNQQYVFPNSLYKAMIETHTARASQSSPDAVTTLASAATLGSQIQRPVFVADLTRDGWSFQGAAVRNVGKYPAGQLFFTKGNASISVFSLPSSAVTGARDGMDYDTVFNGAPIAGFTKGDGLYCIVGSSPDKSLNVDEVKRLLAEHRGEIRQG